MRKTILLIYACILGIGIPYYVFVSIVGTGVPCPIYELTGLLCGSCGISRMLISMIELKCAEAFGYNCFAFILFFIWNLIALLAFIGKPIFFRNRRFLFGAFEVSVFALLIFSIIRNII